MTIDTGRIIATAIAMLAGAIATLSPDGGIQDAGFFVFAVAGVLLVSLFVWSAMSPESRKVLNSWMKGDTQVVPKNTPWPPQDRKSQSESDHTQDET